MQFCPCFCKSKDDPDRTMFDDKVDVLAVGVLVYKLAYGAAPFATKQTTCKLENHVQTVNLIKKGFDGEFPEVRPASCL